MTHTHTDWPTRTWRCGACGRGHARTDVPAPSAALRAVLDLHRADWSCANLAHTNPEVGCPECAEHCAECGQSWPCETVRVITAHIDTTPKETDR